MLIAACGSSGSPDAGLGRDDDGGAIPDAGVAADAGHPADAGVSTDAGTPSDGGVSAPTFTEVYAILANRCAGCHAPGLSGGSGGDLDFSSQSTAYAQLVNQTATGQFCNQSPHTRVIPFDPTHSLLYQKVTKTQDCGSQMPWGEPPRYPPLIPTDEQQAIHDWIAAGALNN